MARKTWLIIIMAVMAMVVPAGNVLAQGVGQTESLEEVQMYYRALHVMVMLLLGFGFLMAFVRGYGRSALTATMLMVSVGLIMYIVISSFAVFGSPASDIEGLVLAEFACASLLICAGAVLGRLKMHQYLLLGVLFIPCYMINEWLVLGGGLDILPAGHFVDTGGSIIIHAFGAFFGLGLIISMTKKNELSIPIESNSTTEKFSLIGTMALWIFWPSFCSALVPPEHIPATAINVILALCGSTLATYIASVYLRGKMSVTDIANATLAGGVAIGATCDHASFPVAILIGVLAGLLSTFGFAWFQSRMQAKLKVVDTCGVTNLHGYPGVMGGIAAMFVAIGIDIGIQMTGIVISLLIAISAGYAAGQVIMLLGRKKKPYDDSDEFVEDEE